MVKMNLFKLFVQVCHLYKLYVNIIVLIVQIKATTEVYRCAKLTHTNYRVLYELFKICERVFNLNISF